MTPASTQPSGEIGTNQPVAGRAVTQRLLLLLVFSALLLGLARRALIGWDAPFWLDEAFTGAIAIQPTFFGLVRDCLNELSGPVYYTLIWCWEKLAGPSNVSLRLPSFIFSVAAPALIVWKGGGEREVRLLWAALAALWLPGFDFANEARPYALLFFLGTGQLILFQRLLKDPTRRRAVAWASISSLLILTHYHALIVTGLQGLAFLALKRKAALATWPAALAFVPVVAWMAVHLPVHLRFADPNVAWQQVLSLGSLTALPYVLIGAGRFSAAIVALLTATVLFDLLQAARRRAPLPYAVNDMAAVGASVAAIAFVYALGFFRPSFVPRYLIPFMPGFLFGLSIWLAVWGKRVRLLPWIVMLPLLWWTGSDLLARGGNPTIDRRWGFSWEKASEDIRASGATGLVFFWDNPTTGLGYKELLARTGGFFFDRDNVQIRTEPLVLPAKGNVDPNRALLEAASGGGALIWAFDGNVPNTLATRYPPRLSAIDPQWRCRDHGRASVTVLACVRRKQATTSPAPSAARPPTAPAAPG
jgi:hypothetical protein